MMAGRLAALAVVIALWHRRQTGEGQHIDLSQLESLIAVSGPAVLAMQMPGGIQQVPNASQEAPAAPHGVYRCADRPEDAPAADRWCAIAVFGDDDWQRFCRALEFPAWTCDPRFAAHSERWRCRDEIDTHLNAWTAGRSAEEVMSRLQAHGIAAGIVANARDLCSRDPQLRHRGFWVATSLPGGGLAQLQGCAFRDDVGERPAVHSAPLAGQHTDAILSAVIGFAPDHIAELRQDGVIL
jgi:benzylsuccinate CoA-transferase BbsF subunit